MNTTLAPQELEEFTKKSNTFNLDTSTHSLAFKYLLDYKVKTEHVQIL